MKVEITGYVRIKVRMRVWVAMKGGSWFRRRVLIRVMRKGKGGYGPG